MKGKGKENEEESVEMVPVTFRVPKPTLTRIDFLVSRFHYRDRTDLLLEATRDKEKELTKQQMLRTDNVGGMGQ